MEKQAYALFETIASGEWHKLRESDDLRPFLPYLVRVSNKVSETALRVRCARFQESSTVRSYLSVDYAEILRAVEIEQHERAKISTPEKPLEGSFVGSLGDKVARDYEIGDASKRIRILLSDLMNAISHSASTKSVQMYISDVLGQRLFLEEMLCSLPVALLFCTELFPIKDTLHGLLCTPYYRKLILSLVSNFTYSIDEVIEFLVRCAKSVSAREREASLMLIALSELSVTVARSVREECIRQKALPALLLHVTCRHIHDEVAFLSCLLSEDLDACVWMWDHWKRALGDQQHHAPSSSFPALLPPSLHLTHPSGVPRRLSEPPELSRRGASTPTQTLTPTAVTSSPGGLKFPNSKTPLPSPPTASSLNSNPTGNSTSRGFVWTDSVNEIVGKLRQEIAKLRDAASSGCRGRAKACVVLKVVCGLVGLTGLRLNSADVSALFDTIVKSGRGERLDKLAVCLLCQCPRLFSIASKAAVGELVREIWSEGQGPGSYVLLWMAVQFHTKQMTAVADMIRSTLALPVLLQTEGVTALSEFLVTDVFPESYIAGQCVSISPSYFQAVGVDQSTMAPQLLACVYQLLKSRVLHRHGVDACEWLYYQISHAEAPIPALLPSCIDEFIQGMFLSTPLSSSSSSSTQGGIGNSPLPSPSPSSPGQPMSKIPERKVLEVFANETNTVAQVLMLYYVLQFQVQWQSSTAAISKTSSQTLGVTPPPQLSKANPVLPTEYSTEQVMTRLPLRPLIAAASAEAGEGATYFYIYPQLLQLATALYPHLFSPLGMLIQLDLVTSHREQQDQTSFKGDEGLLSIEFITMALQKADVDPIRASLVLEWLGKCPPSRMAPYAKPLVNSLLPILIARAKFEDFRLHRLFQIVWERVNSIMPVQFSIDTINNMRPPSATSALGGDVYMYEDFVMDPLLLLRISPFVLRSAPLLRVFLQILSTFLSASRRYYTGTNPSIPSAPLQGQPEINTMLLAQESAAIQMLLEACAIAEDGPPDAGPPEEVQSIMCAFVHQMFIDNSLLIKIVHFQGYPLCLIPICDLGIPSMHICLDFIPELIMQREVEKQIFATLLAAQLSKRYPMPKSLAVAKTVLNRISGCIHTSVGPLMLQHTLPSVVQFCIAFPSLCDQAVDILHEVRTVYKQGNKFLSDLAEQTFAQLAEKVIARNVKFKAPRTE